MQARQMSLYVFMSILLIAIVITALGGGLFQQQAPWLLQWQHQVFRLFCHQIPERSFWLYGQPMAVCSRCLGIYLTFAVGWLTLPAIEWMDIKRTISSSKIVFIAVLLNFFDIIGNILGIWQNTLVSRFVLGALLGGTTSLLFTGDFFQLTKNYWDKSSWKKYKNQPYPVTHHIGHP